MNSSSLCWSCRNASPLRCEWVMASGSAVPAYVTACEVKTLSFDACVGVRSTRIKRDVRVITECRRYRRDRFDETELG